MTISWSREAGHSTRRAAGAKLCEKAKAMKRAKRFTAVVWRERKRHVAQCPEVDVASQGHSEAAAIKNLGEAGELRFAPLVTR